MDLGFSGCSSSDQELDYHFQAFSRSISTVCLINFVSRGLFVYCFRLLLSAIVFVFLFSVLVS